MKEFEKGESVMYIMRRGENGAWIDKQPGKVVDPVPGSVQCWVEMERPITKSKIRILVRKDKLEKIAHE